MNNRWRSIVLTLLSLGALTSVSGISFSAENLPKGWLHAGSHPQDYEMSVDTAVKHGGKAGARIKFIGTNAEGFGTLMQIYKADDYRGKRLRMSAWMKTEDAETANLWLRVDGAKSMLGFDNMHNRAVKGTSEWKKYELTLDVPPEAVKIAFGAFVGGKGQAWVDDYSFEVVGGVPSTNMLTPEQMKKEQEMGPAREYPKQPVNLDFEN